MKALPHTDIAISTPSDVEEPAEVPSAQSEPLQLQEPLAHEHVDGQEVVDGTVLPLAVRDRSPPGLLASKAAGGVLEVRRGGRTRKAPPGERIGRRSRYS